MALKAGQEFASENDFPLFLFHFFPSDWFDGRSRGAESLKLFYLRILARAIVNGGAKLIGSQEAEIEREKNKRS